MRWNGTNIDGLIIKDGLSSILVLIIILIIIIIILIYKNGVQRLQITAGHQTKEYDYCQAS